MIYISAEFPYTAAEIVVKTDNTTIKEEVSDLYHHIDEEFIESLQSLVDDLKWYNEKWAGNENQGL